MSHHRKGSFPHKYKVGQVVYWGNGHDGYVQIVSLNPLHCDGGEPLYYVISDNYEHAALIHFHNRQSQGPVSECALRPLTKKEIRGCQTK